MRHLIPKYPASVLDVLQRHLLCMSQLTSRLILPRPITKVRGEFLSRESRTWCVWMWWTKSRPPSRLSSVLATCEVTSSKRKRDSHRDTVCRPRKRRRLRLIVMEMGNRPNQIFQSLVLCVPMGRTNAKEKRCFTGCQLI